MDVVLDDHASPDILWTFFGTTPLLREELRTKLSPGIDRGRVTFYVNVDCQAILPRLAAAWNVASPKKNSEIADDLKELLPQRSDGSAIHVKLSNGETGRKRSLNFSRGEQDHPPRAEIYVGRSDELAQLEASKASIIYITAIAGSGKSALAAHYLEAAQSAHAFDYFVWRDCKEQSKRFERQLVSVVVALSDGKVTEHELAKQPIETVTELFLDLSIGARILIIFDNVDHYIDLERHVLTGTVARFCELFLKRQSECKLIFTCRPVIEHVHASVLSFRLEGITFADTLELFRQRNAHANETAIRRAHELTRGHVFWLDLIAAQLARRAPQIELADLLRSFDTDTPELPTATLLSIWDTLKERERFVLQALAETVKPTPILRLADYLAPKLRYNQLYKAVKSLRGLSLLVVKPLNGGQELIELHPLVRAFVRRNFPKPERDWFIHAILNAYKAFFGLHRLDLVNRPPTATIDHWSEGAELHISAGEHVDACACLHEIADVVQQIGSPTEFVRVTRLLFQNSEWATLAKAEHFDGVISTYIELQALAGEIDDCTEAFEGYESTLQGKDARYINYCDLRCYMHWVNGDYLTAIKWGAEGVHLKEKSNVDTEFDCSHNLALAQRDAGVIDPALEYFLRGKKLSEVVEDKQGNDALGGAFYGNVGRCLHLMGQIDPALSCYKKSASLLETSEDANLENRAYIRQWVGEVLVSKGALTTGLTFLQAARQKWSVLSPPKATMIDRVMRDVVGDRVYAADTDEFNEKRWNHWIQE